MERTLALTLGCAAATAAAIVFLIVVFVALESTAAISEIGLIRFLTDPIWQPTATAGERGYGVLPMLAGSLLVTAGSMVVAAPIGVSIALFARFHAPPRLGGLLRRVIFVQNGVPSVLFGLWGLTTLVPLIHAFHPPGQSLLAGVLVLALMVTPTVALASDTAFAAIPKEAFLPAEALALGPLQTLRAVILPRARRGIAAGIFLGTARAIGETMVVVMVCGNIVQYPGSAFDPIRTVTANIALEMGYATAAHRSALFVSGLALMVLLGTVALLIRGTRAASGQALAHG